MHLSIELECMIRDKIVAWIAYRLDYVACLHVVAHVVTIFRKSTGISKDTHILCPLTYSVHLLYSHPPPPSMWVHNARRR